MDVQERDIKIDRTRHIALSSSVEYIREIKKTINNQVAQAKKMQREVEQIEGLLEDLHQYIENNEKTLNECYNSI